MLSLLLWLLAGYLALIGVGYVLGARIYFTCALCDAKPSPIAREALDATTLEVLGALDDELVSAGFTHLGFSQMPPFITYYAHSDIISYFANPDIPAYAAVQRRAAPEYNALLEVRLDTVLYADRVLVTTTANLGDSLAGTGRDAEQVKGASIDQLVQRHQDRLDDENLTAHTASQPFSMTHVLTLVSQELALVRALYRQRRWVVPTRNPARDRFTIRGAFALARLSRRMDGKRRQYGRPIVPEPSVDARRLRVAAELHAVMRIADVPEPAPGTPWPILLVLALHKAGPAPGLWLAVILLWIEQSRGGPPLLHAVSVVFLLLNILNLLLWTLLLPRQLKAYRLRRAVASRIAARTEKRSVAQAALETMTDAPYAAWSSAIRQQTTREILRQFAEATASRTGHGWGALAYLFAWVPALIGIVLWAHS